MTPFRIKLPGFVLNFQNVFMTFTNKLVSSNSFKSELGQQTHTVYYIIRVSNVFFSISKSKRY